MRRTRLPSPGFTLIEVTLALAVTAFCLSALFALLPIGLQSNQAAVQETAANGILSTVITDLRATPAQSGATQQFLIPITTGTTTLFFDGESRFSNSIETQSSYRLTVSMQIPRAGNRAATFVNLQMSWPAAAAVQNAAGSVHTFIALDRN